MANRNNAKYAWADWFARGRFRLLRGRDYLCGTAAMAQQIRNAASLRRLSVEIEETQRGLTVTVGEAKAVA